MLTLIAADREIHLARVLRKFIAFIVSAAVILELELPFWVISQTNYFLPCTAVPKTRSVKKEIHKIKKKKKEKLEIKEHLNVN